MSFRRRSEVIDTPTLNPRVPARGLVIPGRDAPPVRPIPPRTGAIPPRTGAIPTRATRAKISNPGVRPSLITSQPMISTGSADVDKLLRHHGLPLGTLLLIKELGTTDFLLVLLRGFVSQGVIHNRLESKQINCHLVIIGVDSLWVADLPGLYKGLKKERQRQRVSENELKVSVSNANMKIAWRYGLNQKSSSPEPQSLTTYENYSHTFDLTEKLMPAATTPDVTFVQLGPFTQLCSQITLVVRSKVKQNPDIVVRIVVPLFLNPSVYPPSTSELTFVVPFIHFLRQLTREFSDNLLVLASIPVDLYQTTLIPTIITNLFDGCLHLEPFAQDVAQLIERVHKAEPQRITHGLVHVEKLPVISEKGEMVVQRSEWAFKNGRKRFEIEAWGIPVDEEEVEEKQTKKDIEF